MPFVGELTITWSAGALSPRQARDVTGRVAVRVANVTERLASRAPEFLTFL